MKSPTLSDVLAALDITRDTFKGWLKRNMVECELPETTQGVARPMTREAALCLAILRVLLAANVPANEAASRAWAFAQLASKARTLLPVWWFSVGSEEAPLMLTADQASAIPEYQLREMFDEREGGILGDVAGKDDDAKEFGRLIRRAHMVRIPMGDVVRHVDRLFAK